MKSVSLWGRWQKITVGITSTLAAIAAVYGGVVFFNDFVFDEVEAGEAFQQEYTKNMSESYAREKGDLNSQVQIVGVELRYLENESDYRALTTSESNRMNSLLAKEAALVNRIKQINCLQDLNRDPESCN